MQMGSRRFVFKSNIYIVFDFIKVFFGGSKPPPYDEPFSLRIVGSGFRPIWRGGHPRAMLVPDASVGIAEKASS